MKYKLITFLLLGIFMISLASAEVNNFAPVKQGETITIKQVCASCSYVNISISYPNSTLVIINKGMINQGGGTWTYEFHNTSAFGRYDVVGSGDLSGVDTGFDVLYFEVTSTGKETPEGVPIFQGIFLIIIFGISCVFLYLSSDMNELGFKIFFLLTAMVFLMATLITGYMISSSTNVLSNINSATLSLIIVFGAIIFILFIYVLIRQTINALDLLKTKKGLGWEIPSGSKVTGYNTKQLY